MLEVVGKVIKKESKIKSAEIIVHEQNGNEMSFQVRSKEVIKLVAIDTGNVVRIRYESDLSEIKKEETITRINNLILKEIIPIGI